MLPLRHVSRWRAAGVFLLCCVLLLALMPEFGLFPRLNLRAARHLDKWLHFLSFTALALWFCGQYARRAYWGVALGLLAFGALIEVCQYLTVYRTADLHDLYADAAGIVLGLFVGLLGAGGWSLRFERWLMRTSA